MTPTCSRLLGRIISAETSVHILPTQCCIPEDGSINMYRCENLKSYKHLNALDGGGCSRQTCYACRESIHDFSVVQPVAAIPTELSHSAVR
jgi:hypothetical protein